MITSASGPLTHCRICGTSNITEVLNLGVQAITGVFPKTRDEDVPAGPLRLKLCQTCGLVQLGDVYDLNDVYTDSYGYRSGLNPAMVAHLRAKANKLMRIRPVTEQDIVLDIGSNDGTFLSFFNDCVPVGVDPLAGKFRHLYPEAIEIIPEFFSKETFRKRFGTREASIITSIAMFYDLPDPRKFASDVFYLLEPGGIWHLEMSYLPTMLEQGSIDTVCHEHLEYYSLSVLRDLFNEFQLDIVDAELNSVNGGSIALTVMHRGVHKSPNHALINWMIEQEEYMGIRSRHPYAQFSFRAQGMRNALTSLIQNLRASGATVAGLGASTKGNVLLQYCGFTEQDIEFVMDVNPEKHGRFTPGTLIPIVSEEEGRARKPDYMLVPIWHFREGVIEREREYLANGGKLIFPLPRIEVVG